MKKYSGMLSTTLAMFAMFFGAGNSVFPVLIGGYTGSNAPYGFYGFSIGSILAPFLGLVAMMMYGGDYQKFFGRLGKRAGFILYTLLIVILGPVGSIPRLLAVSYATISPYLPDMTLTIFSLLSCGLIFLFTYRRSNALSILGLVLTPFLILSITVLIIQGFRLPHEPLTPQMPPKESFSLGLEYGYTLLDMVAAFLYGGLILSQIKRDLPKEEIHGKALIKKIIIRKALICISAGALLLTVAYIGLMSIGAFHSAQVNELGAPEEVIRTISSHLLGPFGGVIASMVVGLGCLTTAISLTLVCSDFITREIKPLAKAKHLPSVITLAISFVLSNFGFSSIIAFIGPILNALHPGLIVLCILNILYKVYGFKTVKIPVFITFLITIAFYAT